MTLEVTVIKHKCQTYYVYAHYVTGRNGLCMGSSYLDSRSTIIMVLHAWILRKATPIKADRIPIKTKTKIFNLDSLLQLAR